MNKSQIQKQSAFTLIELILVMLILFSMLALLSVAFQTFSKSWLKISEKQLNSIDSFKAISLVESAIKSTIPLEALNDKQQLGFYFLGRENGFTAVTENGVLAAGRLAVYRILKEQEEDGTFSLYYEEAPLDGYPLVSMKQRHSFNFRIQVLSKLTKLDFSYRGWENFEQLLSTQVDIQNAIRPSIYNNYDGAVRRIQPLDVIIHLDDYSWNIRLIDRLKFLQGRRGALNEI